MKKVTIVPESIRELPKKEKEAERVLYIRVPDSLYKRVKESSGNTGYSINELAIKSLEAFLK